MFYIQVFPGPEFELGYILISPNMIWLKKMLEYLASYHLNIYC